MTAPCFHLRDRRFSLISAAAASLPSLPSRRWSLEVSFSVGGPGDERWPCSVCLPGPFLSCAPRVPPAGGLWPCCGPAVPRPPAVCGAPMFCQAQPVPVALHSGSWLLLPFSLLSSGTLRKSRLIPLFLEPVLRCFDRTVPWNCPEEFCPSFPTRGVLTPTFTAVARISPVLSC